MIEDKKCGVKLTIIDTLSYHDFREICDAIEKLGYSIILVDNGNVVLTK